MHICTIKCIKIHILTFDMHKKSKKCLCFEKNNAIWQKKKYNISGVYKIQKYICILRRYIGLHLYAFNRINNRRQLWTTQKNH